MSTEDTPHWTARVQDINDCLDALNSDPHISAAEYRSVMMELVRHAGSYLDAQAAPRAKALTRRIAEIAEATGRNVSVGRQGHKDEWFARCDGVEVGGSTAAMALESVVAALVREAERAEREAGEAATRAAAIRVLDR